MKRMTKKETIAAKEDAATRLRELCTPAKRIYVVEVHRSTRYRWSKILLPTYNQDLIDITWHLCRYRGQSIHNRYGGVCFQRGGPYPEQEVRDMLDKMGISVAVRAI